MFPAELPISQNTKKNIKHNVSRAGGLHTHLSTKKNLIKSEINEVVSTSVFSLRLLSGLRLIILFEYTRW